MTRWHFAAALAVVGLVASLGADLAIASRIATWRALRREHDRERAARDDARARLVLSAGLEQLLAARRLGGGDALAGTLGATYTKGEDRFRVRLEPAGDGWIATGTSEIRLWSGDGLERIAASAHLVARVDSRLEIVERRLETTPRAFRARY